MPSGERGSQKQVLTRGLIPRGAGDSLLRLLLRPSACRDSALYKSLVREWRISCMIHTFCTLLSEYCCHHREQ